MGHWVGVVASGEVAVEGGDNGVLFALLGILAVPLADAGTARVRHDDAANGLEDVDVAVTGNGGTDLEDYY